jgi:hypothetical protein
MGYDLDLSRHELLRRFPKIPLKLARLKAFNNFSIRFVRGGQV